jgi:hypothetical protein
MITMETMAFGYHKNDGRPGLRSSFSRNPSAILHFSSPFHRF